VLVMRNGTPQSPFCTALGDSLFVPRPSCGRGGAPRSGAPQRPKMTRRRAGCALHMASAGSGTSGPFATAAIRARLRLPGTPHLVLRTSWRAVFVNVLFAEQQIAKAALIITVATLTNRPQHLTRNRLIVQALHRLILQLRLVLAGFMIKIAKRYIQL
jgi:hypothetical protein